MIQVIQRCSDILNILSEKNKLPLKDIQKLTELNKATLCNILKSLSGAGFVKQNVAGEYMIGDQLIKIAHPYIKRDTLVSLADDFTKELAEKTRESGLLTVYKDTEIILISKNIYDQSIIVNTELNKTMSFYSSCSGRIFMAFLDEKELKKIMEKYGLPDEKNLWKVSNIRELNKRLEEIRKEEIIVREVPERQIVGMAVPIFYPDGSIAASLGLNAPLSRFSGENEKHIIETIKSVGKKMTYALSLFLGKN